MNRKTGRQSALHLHNIQYVKVKLGSWHIGENMIMVKMLLLTNYRFHLTLNWPLCVPVQVEDEFSLDSYCVCNPFIWIPLLLVNHGLSEFPWSALHLVSIMDSYMHHLCVGTKVKSIHAYMHASDHYFQIKNHFCSSAVISIGRRKPK